MTPKDEMAAILQEAFRAVTSERNKTYGEPEHNLQIFESLVFPLIEAINAREGKGYAPLNPGVAGSIIGLLMKISRIVGGPEIQQDTKVDCVGYILTMTRSENVGNHKKEEKANDKN